MIFSDMDGEVEEIRTLGTRFWRPLLYQLSYALYKETHNAYLALWASSAGAAKQI